MCVNVQYIHSKQQQIVTGFLQMGHDERLTVVLVTFDDWNMQLTVFVNKKCLNKTRLKREYQVCRDDTNTEIRQYGQGWGGGGWEQRYVARRGLVRTRLCHLGQISIAPCMTYFINTSSPSPDARNSASGQESKVQSRTEHYYLHTVPSSSTVPRMSLSTAQ